ncbi:MAG: type I-E CRISPR-associated protein Cas6/Cse3/CasE [Elusimicrobia bacterium]|nr:type I-E CRISPR-associated protein Cas6/Cse3/CasE [Elusimicrobiota bacterium]
MAKRPERQVSRIQLRRDVSGITEFWKRLDVDGDYRVHQMIWDLFADRPDRTRDFLYRQEQERGGLSAYAVSSREPRDGTGFWKVETKPYHPALNEGQKLAFSVRVNPVRTKQDEQGRHHRHDVVMERKAQVRAETPCAQWPSEAELVHSEGLIWLTERSERHGFELFLDTIQANGYRQHRFFKNKEQLKISLSTIDIAGVLKVMDTERFLETLYQGLGPAKGFGCGLMLVRPV